MFDKYFGEDNAQPFLSFFPLSTCVQSEANHTDFRFYLFFGILPHMLVVPRQCVFLSSLNRLLFLLVLSLFYPYRQLCKVNGIFHCYKHIFYSTRSNEFIQISHASMFCMIFLCVVSMLEYMHSKGS